MVIRYLISVCNIPWTVSQLELKKYFLAFGNVKNIKIIFDKHGVSTGYGFVQFYDKIAMRNALRTTHILEEEELSVVQGIKYSEEGVEDFIRRYTQEENMQNYVETQYNEENYIKNIYIQEQYTNGKPNNQVIYEKQHSSDNKPSIIKQRLKHKNTLR